MCKHRDGDTRGLEALAVHDARACLVVLVLGDPHLLEGGQGGPLHQHQAIVATLLANGFKSYMKGRQFVKGQFDLDAYRVANVPGSVPLQSVRTKSTSTLTYSIVRHYNAQGCSNFHVPHTSICYHISCSSSST